MTKKQETFRAINSFLKKGLVYFSEGSQINFEITNSGLIAIIGKYSNGLAEIEKYYIYRSATGFWDEYKVNEWIG